MEDRISIYGKPVYSYGEIVHHSHYEDDIVDGVNGYIVHPDVIDALMTAYLLAKRQYEHFIKVCDLFIEA